MDTVGFDDTDRNFSAAVEGFQRGWNLGPALDGGAFPECRRIWVLRGHVRRLEAYRAKAETPVRIISGCRCKRHNARVGGSTSSQHMFGTASDIQGLLTVPQRKRLELFAGLGFKGSTGKVIHVDSRDIGGHNLTAGSPTRPTTWEYGT